jgi:dolichyl-phosphate-mannose-protein mannosyltransferase
MSRLGSLVRRPTVVILAVGLLAGGLRFWHLSSPNERIFDEVYYPKAGCILVGGTNAQCDVTSSAERYWRTDKWDVGSWTHPPLGKWMIGLGEKAFGFDTFGWRVSSAIVGTLTVVMVALLAYLLFGSALWAGLAGLLMAIDGLSFVMSRTGLLDSFTAFWITAGFLLLVLDRRWIERRSPPPEDPEWPAEADADRAEPVPRRVPSPVWRPWRFAAGIAFGASLATKWSGVTALVAAGLLALAWEISRRRGEGVGLGRAVARAITRETFGLVLAFLIVPAGVYMATYLPWFHHFGWSLSTWWDNQVQIADYHKTLQWFHTDPKTGDVTLTHPWLSHAWWWLPMQRPVLFFARYPPGGTRWITTIGNPAVFWGAFVSLPYTAVAWWRRHDWRAALILVAFGLQYFPWFFISRPQFFFYMTPIVPFLVLAAVYTVRDLADMRIQQRDPSTGEIVGRSTLFPYRPFVWGYVAFAVACFVFFYPVLTGAQLSKTAFQIRIWMRSWT